MAKFNGYVLTEKGRELLAKGLAGGKIEFTKMQIGDGTTTTDARNMTSLVNPKKDLMILNIKVTGGQCELTALLSNQNLDTGFYIKELGVFARGADGIEILYAYNISINPDFIPPFNANNIVEIEYVDTLIVDQAANITAVIDPSITYITKETADKTYLEKKKWLETIGGQFGGYVSKVPNKEAGKLYINDVYDNKLYVCVTAHNSTSFDITKYRDITNNGISDQLENLFEIHQISLRNNVPIGKVFKTDIKIPNKPYKLIYSIFTGNGHLVDLNTASQYAGSEIAVNLGATRDGFLQYSVAKNSSPIDGRYIDIMFVF